MANYHLHGIVLQNQDIGERDVLLTLFSLERGKVRFVVRGTKKPESTLRASIEPMTEGHYFIAERRTLDVLSEWEPVDFHEDLKKDVSKTVLAAYLIRFLLELQQENTPEKSMYFLLKNILNIFHTEYKHDIIKLYIEWGFLKASGLAPEFGVCADCGESGSDRKYMWDIEEGGFYCGACAGTKGRRLVNLGLGEMKLGKKIEAGVEQLCLGEISSPEGIRHFTDIYSFDERNDSGYSANLSRAVTAFCRYHLREDVSGWHMNL